MPRLNHFVKSLDFTKCFHSDPSRAKPVWRDFQFSISQKYINAPSILIKVALFLSK